MLRTNHYARNEVVKSMKNYFLPLCHEVRRFVSLTPHKDYSVTLEIGVPRNWDTVRRVRGKISWKPPEPGYKPRWDLDNWFLYHKVMQDVLSEMSIIPDDTIDIFTANHRVYKEVPTLADRYLLLLIQNREHEKISP